MSLNILGMSINEIWRRVTRLPGFGGADILTLDGCLCSL